MIRNDERRGLQLVDERVGFIEMPIGVGFVPHAVEPDAGDGAVVCEKFAQLAVHIVVDVRVKVSIVGAAVIPSGATAGVIIGVVPIKLRIIEKEFDALLVCFVGELLERILAVRRALDDVPIRNFRVEHGEAIVMARSDGDVFHAGGFGEGDPGFRIKFFGIEKFWQPLVIANF